MADELIAVDLNVLSEVVSALNRLEPEPRRRLLASLMTLFGVDTSRVSAGVSVPRGSESAGINPVSFSEDRSISPKDFVWQKQPKTSIERVVCLAYYLQHLRGMSSFKTSDISSLNTEAAQVKFSNPAMMVSEATRAGYLATVRGQDKQLTAIGEQFVMHLPDREAALKAVKHARPRRSKRRTATAREAEIAA